MTSTTTSLLIGGLGGMELLIILAVLVLLFGASKLPELARGSGQALRIFKAETKGLMDDDDGKGKHRPATPVVPVTEAKPVVATEPVTEVQPVVEAHPVVARDTDVARG